MFKTVVFNVAFANSNIPIGHNQFATSVERLGRTVLPRYRETKADAHASWSSNSESRQVSWQYITKSIMTIRQGAKSHKTQIGYISVCSILDVLILTHCSKIRQRYNRNRGINSQKRMKIGVISPLPSQTKSRHFRFLCSRAWHTNVISPTPLLTHPTHKLPPPETQLRTRCVCV